MEVQSHLHTLVTCLRQKKKKKEKETGWAFKSVVMLLRRIEKSLSPAGGQTEVSRSPSSRSNDYTERHILAPHCFAVWSPPISYPKLQHWFKFHFLLGLQCNVVNMCVCGGGGGLVGEFLGESHTHFTVRLNECFQTRSHFPHHFGTLRNTGLYLSR